MWFEEPIPNSNRQERHRKILQTAYALDALGIRPFKNRHLRWLMAEPETELFGARSLEEAERLLGQALRKGLSQKAAAQLPEDQATELARRLRQRTPFIDLDTYENEDDVSVKQFGDYLDHEVKVGWLVKVRKGEYQFNHSKGVLSQLTKMEDSHCPIGTTAASGSGNSMETMADRCAWQVQLPAAFGFPAPDQRGGDKKVQAEGEKLLTVAGDVLALVGEAMSLVHLGHTGEDGGGEGPGFGFALWGNRYQRYGELREEDPDIYREKLGKVREKLSNCREELSEHLRNVKTKLWPVDTLEGQELWEVPPEHWAAAWTFEEAGFAWPVEHLLVRDPPVSRVPEELGGPSDGSEVSDSR